MPTPLYYPPLDNGLQKTLASDLTTGSTASMTLNNATRIQDEPGVVVIDRIDTAGVLKSAALREYISYAGTSGSTLTTLVRALGGSTDQDHSTGAVVEFVPDINVFQSIISALAILVDPDDISAYNSAIATLTGTQVLTNKTLTAPQINDTSDDHQYIIGVSELTADRTATLPLLTGNDVFTLADFIQTLTNKRITQRVTTEASSGTPTVNSDNTDLHSITALAAAITSMTSGLTGTPTNGQKLIYRILDDGTGRAITWGASFQDMGTALPTTTTASKVLTVGFIYDTVDSKWGCVASQDET